MKIMDVIYNLQAFSDIFGNFQKYSISRKFITLSHTHMFSSTFIVSNTPGNLLELFFLLKIFWNLQNLQKFSFQEYTVSYSAVTVTVSEGWMIGIGWDLSPHASSFKLKFTVSKTSNSTEFSSKCVLETPGNQTC